jgi:hypothetical protein
MAYVNSPLDLAKTIAGMSYSGLRAVASELVAMNVDADAGRDVGTDHGMADTLSDWAEAQVEAAEEEAKVAKLAAGKAA